MTKELTISQRLDEFGRQRPRLMWLVNTILLLFVTVVLLMSTEAPLVLYQAF